MKRHDDSRLFRAGVSSSDELAARQADLKAAAAKFLEKFSELELGLLNNTWLDSPLDGALPLSQLLEWLEEYVATPEQRAAWERQEREQEIMELRGRLAWLEAQS